MNISPSQVFFKSILSRKTGGVEVDCYLKMVQLMVTPINHMLLLGPDLYCAGALAL